VQNIC